MTKKLVLHSKKIRHEWTHINTILGQNLDLLNNELKALKIVQIELKNNDNHYIKNDASINLVTKKIEIIEVDKIDEDIELMNGTINDFNDTFSDFNL